MKISVRVKTKSKEERVEKLKENNFLVFVKEPAQKGKANEAVIKAMAGYFKTSKSNVKIIAGFRVKQKILEIVL